MKIRENALNQKKDCIEYIKKDYIQLMKKITLDKTISIALYK